LSSVVALRVPSINAGLLASTVTPGSTAPVASRTTPAMLPVCATAIAGTSARISAAAIRSMVRSLIIRLPWTEKSCKEANGNR
jgi:hypothetical protein